MSYILINCDFDERPNPRAFLYRSYADSVIRAGGLPVMMPILKKKDKIRSLLKDAGGILLSGGDDPNPARYREKLHTATRLMNQDKEECDFMLASEALKSAKPVLGICWGLQLMNLALGGTLVQDIPTHVENAVTHRLPRRQPAYHDVAIVEDSLLAGILHSAGDEGARGAERTAQVNSFHHQAVKGIGKGLRSVASAQDGVIEAVEGGSDRFLLGVQWHPERMPDDPFARRLFQAFVRATTRA